MSTETDKIPGNFFLCRTGREGVSSWNVYQCVPVAGTSARKKSTLSSFLERLEDITEGPAIPHYQVTYCPELEKAVSMVEPAVKNWLDTHELPFYTTSRFLSLRLLEDDPSFLRYTQQV